MVRRCQTACRLSPLVGLLDATIPSPPPRHAGSTYTLTPFSGPARPRMRFVTGTPDAGPLLRGPLTHCASCARVAAGCVTQDHGTDEPGEPGTSLRTYAGRRRRRRRWLAPRERASHPSRTDRAKVVCPTPCFAARDWRVSRSSLWRRTAICSVRAGRIARSRSSRSPANSSTL